MLLKKSMRQVAMLLSATLSDETIAAIMNDLVCVEDNDDLAVDVCDSGKRLFNELTEMRPDAVAKATK